MSVLITGHSRGLGAALAACYLGRGERVLGLGRTLAPATAGLVQVVCDLSRTDGIVSALEELCRAGGAPELVFLNAGVLGPIAAIRDTPVATLAAVMNTNTWANKRILDWLATREPPPAQVVAISSGAAVVGHHGWGAYALSKAALNMLIQLYAHEMPRTHLVALAPGLVDTAMQAELRAVDRLAFPSVARVQDAHGTAAMPAASEVARRIATALTTVRGHPSGSYVDLRDLASV